MFADIASVDAIITALSAAGILQLCWLSIMLLRRGITPATIQQVILPPLAIWALMWPVYVDSRWIWATIALLGTIALLSLILRQRRIWQELGLAWRSDQHLQTLSDYKGLHLMPLLQLMTALVIAALWFQYIPEFGFGLILCLCIAFPAADLIDMHAANRLGFIRLGFPAHPTQTLGGHLLFISTSTTLLCWSLHVYHGTAWQALFIATLIASLTASATRAIMPGQWHMPATMITVGAVMWML